jgi:hypothetical protein
MLQYGVTPTICLLGTESLWFHHMSDRKGNHNISRNSMNLVLYWHLKDSGYSSYKIKIQKGVMKHSMHLATQYIPPTQNMDYTLCLGAGKHWLMIKFILLSMV